MATEAQIEANRRNAALSTGPRTAEGLQASSQNAFKFGFRSQKILLPHENPAEFESLLADLTAELQPSGDIEARFVREMAEAEWCLARVKRITTQIFAHEDDLIRSSAYKATPEDIEASAFTSALRIGSYLAAERYQAAQERKWDRNLKALLAYRKSKASQPEPKLASFGKTAIQPPKPRPQTPETPQTARNAPCPCGSGAKFKRCCGQNAPPILNPAA